MAFCARNQRDGAPGPDWRLAPFTAGCAPVPVLTDSLAGRGYPQAATGVRRGAADRPVAHRAGARVWGWPVGEWGKEYRSREEQRGTERECAGDVSWCGYGKQNFGLLGLIGPSDGEEEG